MSEKEIEMIVNFGALGYDEKKISSILGRSINIQDQDVAKYYQKGKDMADYAIDLKLFEMAKSGDIKALEKFERRKMELKSIR